MAEDKIRLGGMALANGVLVHGPKAWACAIRTDDGRLKVAARPKRLRSPNIDSPLLRGPVRLLDALAILPEIRRAPARVRTQARLGAQFVALAASTEIFGWMVRNPEKRLARALAKPGHELQHRIATAEPTPEQIEVAEAALLACLELEEE